MRWSGFLPNVHEHVAEETPHLEAVSGMVHQGALHEVWLVCLQYPLIQHDAVAHEHNDLTGEATHALGSYRVSSFRHSFISYSTEFCYESQLGFS